MRELSIHEIDNVCGAGPLADAGFALEMAGVGAGALPSSPLLLRRRLQSSALLQAGSA
jgi:hypothetical protein